MPQQHSYELVASNLASWLDEKAKDLADGMREGGRAPFAARATEQQKLHYYHDQFFNPDGSPNDIGRAAAEERLGKNQFYATLAQVTQARQGRGNLTALGPEVTGEQAV